MDRIGQMAIDLLRQKCDQTRRVLTPGRSVTLDADSITQDLERIMAQLIVADEDPSYTPPQLAR